MFFLWLILILIAVIILFVTSTIEIEFKNLEINVPKVKGELLNKKSKIIVRLYIFKKIKIFSLNIDKTKFEKKQIKNQIEKFAKKIEKNQNNFDLKVIKVLKFLNINIMELDLNICLGLENASITGILVGAISSLLAILLRNKIKNLEKQKFIIKPIYQNANILNIEINGIFKINMRNIIYIILKFLEKGKVMKNDRTSNRRSYAYSNE